MPKEVPTSTEELVPKLAPTTTFLFDGCGGGGRWGREGCRFRFKPNEAPTCTGRESKSKWPRMLIRIFFDSFLSILTRAGSDKGSDGGWRPVCGRRASSRLRRGGRGEEGDVVDGGFASNGHRILGTVEALNGRFANVSLRESMEYC